MSGSDGPRGLDRGIAALRWLLVSAQENDSARAQVLPALSRCTVLVPTMTGTPDKLRFLAQPSGGSAMVVFTGHDALEHAAKKLGWAHGTQSVSFRAMSARDALETAQLQGVRSVIVDAAAEHALELRYDEVSMYLSRGTAEFAPEFVEPSSRGTGEYGLPQPRKASGPGAARATGEFSPRTGEVGVTEVREEVAAPRKARDARRDEGGGMRARVERMMAQSEPQEAGEPSHDARPAAARGRDQATQPMASSSTAAAVARKRNLAEIDDPFISSTPRQAPAVAGGAGGQARRVPSLAAPPLSRDMPSVPFESSRPPSSPIAEDATPVTPAAAFAARAARFNYDRDQTIPLEDISSAQAARASAERAKLEPAQSTPLEMFGSADSAPAPPPQQAVVAMRPIVVEAAPAAPAVAPAPAPVPAQVPAPRAKEPDAEPARGTGTVAKPAPAAAPADTGSGEPTTNPGASLFIGPELGDAVLSAVAEELRKFPEAEWACQLPDDGELHVIGVRVDPSYLARTKNIEAAVAGAARKAGAVVQPLIVSTPAATKDARARGSMFFPWKKKK